MTYMWAACSFTYYMIAIYLKYIPGSIYLNMLGSGIAEVAAVFIGGWIYSKFGIKLSFCVLFALSVFGGVCIFFLGESSNAVAMTIFVTIAKFGISGAFCIVYVSNSEVFPTLFCSSAMGITNLASRLLTIMSA